jgi:hypothetical protein
MTFGNLTRPGATIAVSVFLATLAAAAPHINAESGPPRSVFLRLPGDAVDPTVAMDLEPRPDGRWRLRIDTDGFTFTSLCLTEAAAVPVGHAHVIVDGVKVASAFHPVIDLDPLPPGKHDVTVVLRGQDHRALLGRHGLIKAEAVVTVGKG